MARSKPTTSPVRKSTPPTAKSTPPKAKRTKSMAPVASASASGGNGTSAATGSIPPAPDAIAARAYELYVQSGYAHGHDEEHWLQAERELTA